MKNKQNGNFSLEYVLSFRTGGANPFAIFESLPHLSQDGLRWAIVKIPYHSFLKTAYWFAVSSVAKARAGMRCQVCNSGNGIQVHHRTYDNHGCEHNNMVDLVVLCSNCHGLFHGHVTIEYKPPALPRGIRAKSTKVKMVIPHEPVDVQLPPGQGWPLRLLDKSYPRATLRAAVEGRFHFNSGALKFHRGKLDIARLISEQDASDSTAGD